MTNFLTFDSKDRCLKCDHSLEKLLSSTSVWCCLLFNFTQFVVLEKLSVLDLRLSGVKGLTKHFELLFKLACTGNINFSDIVPLRRSGYSFERNCVLRRWESETLK